MTSQNDSTPSQERSASRRDFVTAVTAVAAASAAVAPVSAQAQTAANVRHSNPAGMSQPTAYSQVVEVNGPHRLIFVAGQTGFVASGKALQGFRAQAEQVFANIKTALTSLGGSTDNIVKLTAYLTDIQQNADVYREVRAASLPNKTALPASTLVQVTRLAEPSYLIEVEVMAVLPPRA